MAPEDSGPSAGVLFRACFAFWTSQNEQAAPSFTKSMPGSGRESEIEPISTTDGGRMQINADP